MGPPDAILGLNEKFNADTNPKKVSLGVGAYRDDDGKPLILECVEKAKAQILANPALNHEYLPITGLAPFVDKATDLAFGDDCVPKKEGRLAATQVRCMIAQCGLL